jgi:hypothetical protein
MSSNRANDPPSAVGVAKLRLWRRTVNARLPGVADWVTISSLATAGGTLVLAGATFASVRSANRAARVAEQSLMTGMRPLLIPSRLEDSVQKVNFVDDKVLVVGGGAAVAELGESAVYFAISLRNAGSGIAVLHGWRFERAAIASRGQDHPPLEEFTRLTRDLYVPAGDTGFWQGAFRDPSAAEFAAARAAAEGREQFRVDILYGDFEGGQRVITRFGLLPRDDGTWYAAVGRHWNVDRADPR